MSLSKYPGTLALELVKEGAAMANMINPINYAPALSRMAAVLGAVVVLQGCVLVPFIDAAKQAGVTKGDRERKLAEAVKGYENALYWGNTPEALAFVTEEARPKVQHQVALDKRERRIVSTNVLETNFDESAHQATVTVATKRFSNDTLVVKEEFEKQQWEFSLAEGWKLRTTAPASATEALS